MPRNAFGLSLSPRNYDLLEPEEQALVRAGQEEMDASPEFTPEPEPRTDREQEYDRLVQEEGLSRDEAFKRARSPVKATAQKVGRGIREQMKLRAERAGFAADVLDFAGMPEAANLVARGLQLLFNVGAGAGGLIETPGAAEEAEMKGTLPKGVMSEARKHEFKESAKALNPFYRRKPLMIRDKDGSVRQPTMEEARILQPAQAVADMLPDIMTILATAVPGGRIAKAGRPIVGGLVKHTGTATILSKEQAEHTRVGLDAGLSPFKAFMFGALQTATGTPEVLMKVGRLGRIPEKAQQVGKFKAWGSLVGKSTRDESITELMQEANQRLFLQGDTNYLRSLAESGEIVPLAGTLGASASGTMGGTALGFQSASQRIEARREERARKEWQEGAEERRQSAWEDRKEYNKVITTLDDDGNETQKDIGSRVPGRMSALNAPFHADGTDYEAVRRTEIELDEDGNPVERQYIEITGEVIAETIDDFVSGTSLQHMGGSKSDADQQAVRRVLLYRNEEVRNMDSAFTNAEKNRRMREHADGTRRLRQQVAQAILGRQIELGRELRGDEKMDIYFDLVTRWEPNLKLTDGVADTTRLIDGTTTTTKWERGLRTGRTPLNPIPTMKELVERSYRFFNFYSVQDQNEDANPLTLRAQDLNSKEDPGVKMREDMANAQFNSGIYDNIRRAVKDAEGRAPALERVADSPAELFAAAVNEVLQESGRDIRLELAIMGGDLTDVPHALRKGAARLAGMIMSQRNTAARHAPKATAAVEAKLRALSKDKEAKKKLKRISELQRALHQTSAHGRTRGGVWMELNRDIPRRLLGALANEAAMGTPFVDLATHSHTWQGEFLEGGYADVLGARKMALDILEESAYPKGGGDFIGGFLGGALSGTATTVADVFKHGREMGLSQNDINNILTDPNPPKSQEAVRLLETLKQAESDLEDWLVQIKAYPRRAPGAPPRINLRQSFAQNALNNRGVLPWAGVVRSRLNMRTALLHEFQAHIQLAMEIRLNGKVIRVAEYEQGGVERQGGQPFRPMVQVVDINSERAQRFYSNAVDEYIGVMGENQLAFVGNPADGTLAVVPQSVATESGAPPMAEYSNTIKQLIPRGIDPLNILLAADSSNNNSGVPGYAMVARINPETGQVELVETSDRFTSNALRSRARVMMRGEQGRLKSGAIKGGKWARTLMQGAITYDLAFLGRAITRDAAYQIPYYTSIKGPPKWLGVAHLTGAYQLLKHLAQGKPLRRSDNLALATTSRNLRSSTRLAEMSPSDQAVEFAKEKESILKTFRDKEHRAAMALAMNALWTGAKEVGYSTETFHRAGIATLVNYFGLRNNRNLRKLIQKNIDIPPAIDDYPADEAIAAERARKDAIFGMVNFADPSHWDALQVAGMFIPFLHAQAASIGAEYRAMEYRQHPDSVVGALTDPDPFMSREFSRRVGGMASHIIGMTLISSAINIITGLLINDDEDALAAYRATDFNKRTLNFWVPWQWAPEIPRPQGVAATIGYGVTTLVKDHLLRDKAMRKEERGERLFQLLRWNFEQIEMGLMSPLPPGVRSWIAAKTGYYIDPLSGEPSPTLTPGEGALPAPLQVGRATPFDMLTADMGSILTRRFGGSALSASEDVLPWRKELFSGGGEYVTGGIDMMIGAFNPDVAWGWDNKRHGPDPRDLTSGETFLRAILKEIGYFRHDQFRAYADNYFDVKESMRVGRAAMRRAIEGEAIGRPPRAAGTYDPAEAGHEDADLEFRLDKMSDRERAEAEVYGEQARGNLWETHPVEKDLRFNAFITVQEMEKIWDRMRYVTPFALDLSRAEKKASILRDVKEFNRLGKQLVEFDQKVLIPRIQERVKELRQDEE